MKTPEDNLEYERKYSHSHCWTQGKNPACGQKLENHKQCCLCDTVYKPRPKVATSEKEYLCPFCKGNFGISHAMSGCTGTLINYGATSITPNTTPHESEDWEILKAEFLKSLGFITQPYPKQKEKIADWWIEKIKDRESKAYQRGREEGLLEGYNRDDKNLIPKLKADLLSLAVQEIRKHAKQNTYEGDEALVYKTTMNEVESIISGVMKK